jgi:adenylate cyclase
MSFWRLFYLRGDPMTTEKVKRKLTAILSADVKGYSRLMGEDEVGTIRILQTYRGVISDLVQKRSGRVVDSPGDNVLAEFASVVDALESAVEIQRELKVRNADRSESRRMEFRIGINLGDVVEEGERIYGDGVNIAARIEGLAEGGGICISGTAFDQIGKRLPLGYEYMGEQEVKNIEKPVRVYRVLMEPESAGKVIGEEAPKQTRWKWKTVAAVVVLVLVVGGLVWNFYWRASKIEPASMQKMMQPLPDKPSIAVLPFVNMSSDSEQEYFADGLTEEIITALSKVPRVFVIARNSSFIYKGKPVRVQQVSEELGVQYVLEGSVRKDENRVRVTAQLVDALNGRHLWAETFDRELQDIFALQDQISFKVVAALQVKLTEGEQALIVAGRTANFEAYAKFLQGVEYVKQYNREGNLLARRMAEEAIRLDASYPRGYRLLATTHWVDVRLGFSKDPRQSLTDAAQLYQKVILMDPSDAVAHSFLGQVYTMMGQHEKGISEAEKAVALAPNAADTHAMYGFVLHFSGRDSEAIDSIHKAIRLNPAPPNWYFAILGQAYCQAGQYNDAIVAYHKALSRQSDNLPVHLCLAAAYSLSNDETNAHAEIEEVLRLNTKYSVENAAKASPYRNQTDKDRFIDALRKAGLPEKPPLPLPDKPSIAVLPFVNMSDDKSQEYFSDGLTEEIITALSKTPKLFVIARNSSFVYKGKPVNVQQVSRELGVKYVLEGSVRKSGDQLRITAQLIDATTGNHLWAERYDREMKDIFAIQDEVTMKILTSLQVTLTEGEQARFFARGTNSLEAYLKIWKARDLLLRLNKDDNALAIKESEEAIALDPKYSRAFASLSTSYSMNFYFGVHPKESLQKAYEYAQKAIALDETQLSAYIALEFVHGWKREYEKAIAAGEKAVEVAPGCADAYLTLGRALNMACKDNKAIEYVEKAIRLNPFPPTHYYMHLGFANLHLRNYDQAVTAFKKALSLSPKNQPARGALIVTYVEMGKMDEARAAAEELLRIDPRWTSKGFEKMSPYKDPEVTKRRVDAWRKVGLERDISAK